MCVGGSDEPVPTAWPQHAAKKERLRTARGQARGDRADGRADGAQERGEDESAGEGPLGCVIDR